jgi:hypothetical protein
MCHHPHVEVWNISVNSDKNMNIGKYSLYIVTFPLHSTDSGQEKKINKKKKERNGRGGGGGQAIKITFVCELFTV